MPHAVLFMNVRCESFMLHPLSPLLPAIPSTTVFPVFLIAEAVNASHRPSATDNVLDAYQLRS